MAIEFLQARESDLPEITALLHRVFGTDETHLAFQPEPMRWKYFAPHPFWQGTRMYILRSAGEIAACAGIIPFPLRTPSGKTVSAAVVIDWAAGRTLPGSGVIVFRSLQRLVDVLMGIGGSDKAQDMIPKLGFEVRGHMDRGWSVTNPLRYAAGPRPLDWKTPLRVGRDYLHRRRFPHAGEWSMRPVKRFDAAAAAVMPASPDAVVCQRTPELLNYFLDCPAAVMHGYLLYRENRPAGYCVISVAADSARIAEIWVDSGWDGAYALALRTAASLDGVAEVVASASFAPEIAAMRHCGLRFAIPDPIFLKDPDGKLPRQAALAVGFLITDGFFRVNL